MQKAKHFKAMLRDAGRLDKVKRVRVEEKVLAPINALSPGESAASMQAYDSRNLFCAVSQTLPFMNNLC